MRDTPFACLCVCVSVRVCECLTADVNSTTCFSPYCSVGTTAVPTARRRSPRSSVRVFEGIKDKSPDEVTYIHVVNALKPVIEELQLTTPEELDLQ